MTFSGFFSAQIEDIDQLVERESNRTRECELLNNTGVATETPLVATSPSVIGFNCSGTPEPPVPPSEICWENMIGQVRGETRNGVCPRKDEALLRPCASKERVHFHYKFQWTLMHAHHVKKGGATKGEYGTLSTDFGNVTKRTCSRWFCCHG